MSVRVGHLLGMLLIHDVRTSEARAGTAGGRRGSRQLVESNEGSRRVCGGDELDGPGRRSTRKRGMESRWAKKMGFSDGSAFLQPRRAE